MQLFLGDGAPTAPHLELLTSLPPLMSDLGWSSCALEQASRTLAIAPAERWTPIADDRLDPCCEAGSPLADFEAAVSELALPLSRSWPVVALRLAGGKALAMLLFRDGAIADRYANRPTADSRFEHEDQRRAHAGSPEAWADLLGTRRNASRLERVWGISTSAELVLPQTAEIVGWDLDAVSHPERSTIGFAPAGPE